MSYRTWRECMERVELVMSIRITAHLLIHLFTLVHSIPTLKSTAYDLHSSGFWGHSSDKTKSLFLGSWQSCLTEVASK